MDPQDPVLSAVTSLARELSDPIRLTALQLLVTEGPHTMSRLADVLGVSAPRLGNHLARLRASGLVTVDHTGRHAVYRASGAGLGDVLATLARYAHHDELRVHTDRPPAAADIAHTCYDHAAGRLGVAVFATLVERGVLRPPDGRDSEVELGTDTTPLADLGVEWDAVDPGRRKLATACLDRTHRLPHLGGVLGKAVLDAFVRDGLVERRDGSRALVLTTTGTERLPGMLRGFAVPPPR